MANALYGKGRNAFLRGDIDWVDDDIRLILVDTAPATGYTVSIDTHEFLQDVPPAARIAVSTALLGRTAALGVADASNYTFAAVAGATVEVLVLYQHKAADTETTSRLIGYLDSFTVNGGSPPLSPDGGSVTVQWDDGASKVFKL